MRALSSGVEVEEWRWRCGGEERCEGEEMEVWRRGVEWRGVKVEVGMKLWWITRDEGAELWRGQSSIHSTNNV